MFKKFISKLQNADLPVKRRALVILSTICAMFVFLIWISELGGIIKNATAKEKSSPHAIQGPLRMGATAIFKSGEYLVKSLSAILTSGKSYSVSPSE